MKSTLQVLMTALLLSLFSLLPALVADAMAGAKKDGDRKIAFLLVDFQNDNADLDPTSDAERARMEMLRKQFKETLTRSGGYSFLSVSDAQRAKFKSGQQLGRCGGCEIEYGKELGADSVAWIEVQKVSNLIMNLNVYMADVATGKATFVHSVDIRGNTDQTWKRSLKYLLENYFFAARSQ